jgi:hypothetical protein
VQRLIGADFGAAFLGYFFSLEKRSNPRRRNPKFQRAKAQAARKRVREGFKADTAAAGNTPSVTDVFELVCYRCV